MEVDVIINYTGYFNDVAFDTLITRQVRAKTLQNEGLLCSKMPSKIIQLDIKCVG